MTRGVPGRMQPRSTYAQQRTSLKAYVAGLSDMRGAARMEGNFPGSRYCQEKTFLTQPRSPRQLDSCLTTDSGVRPSADVTGVRGPHDPRPVEHGPFRRKALARERDGMLNYILWRMPGRHAFRGIYSRRRLR